MNHASRVIITDKEKESVLLGKRANRPEIHKWNIIGGKPDKGEEDSVAARREVFEEAGLILPILNFLFDDVYNDWTTHYYSARVDKASDLAHSDEHTELQWFTFAELEQIADQLAFNHYLILQEYFSF